MKHSTPRPLKILMPVLCFDEVPEGWTYFKEIALRLDSLGHKIIILSPHLKDKKYREEVRNITIYRFSTIKFPKTPLIFNPIAFISVFLKLMRIETKIDIIYDTTSGLIPSSLFIKLILIIKNMKIPIVTHVFGELKGRRSLRLISLLLFELYLNIIARFTYAMSDKILLAGIKIVPRVIRLGANPKKLKIVHAGLKYEDKLLKHLVVLNKKEIDKIRTSFDINDKDFVIGYVGLLSVAKGVETLFRAISIVKQNLPNIKLILIGSGVGLKQHFSRLSYKLGIQDITLFLGYRNDVINLLQIMDLFVNLSFSEAGISATQIEAMRCGLPSVITPFTDLVDNMKEAIIVPFNNVQAVNDAILFMYHNEESRKRIGHNAFIKSEKLIQRYTWNSYLNGVICVFEKVLEDANRLI